MLQTTPSPRLGWRLLTSILIVLATTGCASLGSADAPGCSGPRRAANPHGSVLAAEAAPAAPSGGAGMCAGGRS